MAPFVSQEWALDLCFSLEFWASWWTSSSYLRFYESKTQLIIFGLELTSLYNIYSYSVESSSFWSWIPKTLEWSLISLSLPSAFHQLPGTVAPWFQVSILTASILMNRFHHLIPGFFSPIELCFLSSSFSPPTILHHSPPLSPKSYSHTKWLNETRYLSQVITALFHCGHVLYVENLPYPKPGASSLFLSCPYLKQLGIPPRLGSLSPSQSLPCWRQLIPARFACW